MAKSKKIFRPKARLPKGMRDVGAGELRQLSAMLAAIRGVYEAYGFEPLETPAFEYTDALGKFLPDQERPNAGVFSFQDEDNQWLSLRYDLTAPLARYVAQNYDALPKPFRRYACGPVWRNEKPGPGRFRQFMQFDADTVGAEGVQADAEMCMLAADTMEALGIKRGEYVIKVNSRKIIDGVLETIGLIGEDRAKQRLTVMRAIDKFERLGLQGVRALLGKGRKDDSGDFTPGAGLRDDQVEVICVLLAGEARAFFNPSAKFSPPTENPLLKEKKGGVVFPSPFSDSETTNRLFENQTFNAGLGELNQIRALVEDAGFGPDQIMIDQTVVRGLEYYTGPVFEAELTFKTEDDKGRPVRFGSVGGGGRYDGLVARFKGVQIPATGFSIGVSRLQAALAHLGRAAGSPVFAPVVVLVMDKSDLPRYQGLARELRNAGIRAEMYLGSSGMKAQMKYADKRGAPCVVIQGEDEIKAGKVQIKDLIEGTKLSQSIETAKQWREDRPAQFEVDETKMVAAVRDVLSRHES